MLNNQHDYSQPPGTPDLGYSLRPWKGYLAEILAALPDPPGYSATRALLRILEQKGHVRHEEDGPRYVFIPCVSRQKASVTALRHVLNTFFDGSR